MTRSTPHKTSGIFSARTDQGIWCQSVRTEPPRRHHGGPVEVHDLAENDILNIAQLPRIEGRFEVRGQLLALTKTIQAGEVLGGCRRESRRKEAVNRACDPDAHAPQLN